MKRLRRPNISATTLFRACTEGVSDDELATRLKAAESLMAASAANYDSKALAHQFDLLPASKKGHQDQLVIAGLTKSELTSLYSTHMVALSKPARTFYDQLLMLAPHGKCPFCGFGHARTLDHFLSKARYPAYSVLPNNLVPACADCNTIKSSPVATQNSIPIHPYFEGSSVETDAWLFAEVSESNPVLAKFFIRPPLQWPDELKSRLDCYFKSLKLASRFSVEAASEIVSISSYLTELSPKVERIRHLELSAKLERTLKINSWRTALYEALASNIWFHEKGYLIATFKSMETAVG
jgi:hypothetical protein